MTNDIQFGNMIQCPHCSGTVQVRELSVREIRDELLRLAGAPVPPTSGPHYSATTTVNKEQLNIIYRYVLSLTEKK